MQKKQEVLAWLDEHKLELAQFLGDMIKIPSVNPTLDPDSPGEYDVQQFIKSKMEGWGFPVTVRTFDEKGRRPNSCAAYLGTGGGKDIMFQGHSDTVPVHADQRHLWQHDPFSGEFDGTWIHGRGAGDDKWGIAAGVFALRALKECGVELSGNVYALASSGEESGEGGTVGPGCFVRDMEKRPDYVIICEGANMEICPETPSGTSFTVFVPGKSTHPGLRARSVFPQPRYVWGGTKEGVDALQKAMPIIDALYRLERDMSLAYDRGGLAGKGDDSQGVGTFAICPTRIDGGNGHSMMGGVTINYYVQHPATYSQEEMFEICKNTVETVAKGDWWLKDHMPVVERRGGSVAGYVSDANHEAVHTMQESFKEALGRPTKVSCWLSQCDGSFVNPYVPCSVFGPQPPNTHAPNERITLHEVLECTKVFAITAMNYCK